MYCIWIINLLRKNSLTLYPNSYVFLSKQSDCFKKLWTFGIFFVKTCGEQLRSKELATSFWFPFRKSTISNLTSAALLSNLYYDDKKHLYFYGSPRCPFLAVIPGKSKILTVHLFSFQHGHFPPQPKLVQRAVGRSKIRMKGGPKFMIGPLLLFLAKSWGQTLIKDLLSYLRTQGRREAWKSEGL